MADLLSPGIQTKEFNFTTVVPSVASTEGCIAGVFRWGPINEINLMSSEPILVQWHGKPTNFNTETFFTAADFLAYGNKLYVTRVVSNDAFNAGSNGLQISNREQAETLTDFKFIARYPGLIGNDIGYSICASSDAFSSPIPNIQINVGDNYANIANPDGITISDIIKIGNPQIGYQDMKVSSILGQVVGFEDKFKLSDNKNLEATRFWRYYKTSGLAPLKDTIHIVVYDATGAITGIPNNVIESYLNVSLKNGSKTIEGENNYYREIINKSSRWIYACGQDLSFTSKPEYTQFKGGTDGEDENTIGLDKLALGYNLYKTKENIDVSLVLTGKSVHGVNGTGLANYLLDNIALSRKDVVVFISPTKEAVVNNAGYEAKTIISFINSLTRTSYGFLDSGYKFRYDKYNDRYVWTPLNGDIAGLAVRTDEERDAWWSPAGYNRGQIKNVVKLAYNPNQSDRDILYPAGCNAVISQPAHGTILFGDKTLDDIPNAFDRINVRRLFIVLEKAIARAAKSYLFEFNDEFTRTQFRNMVEPYLRDVQGKRGIIDFRVVCDETNNTPDIVDKNQFVGDIYIKPARSINFITLNFVAVNTNVEFSEIVGKYGG